jgi:hypothetical protein
LRLFDEWHHSGGQFWVAPIPPLCHLVASTKYPEDRPRWTSLGESLVFDPVALFRDQDNDDSRLARETLSSAAVPSAHMPFFHGINQSIRAATVRTDLTRPTPAKSVLRSQAKLLYA